MPAMNSNKPIRTILATIAATAGTMVCLDLAWLGLVARPFYDSSLGELKRSTVLWPAAALFYVFYVGATVILAVLGAASPGSAAKRGAILGLVAYATYELTNWAVLKGWPARLVPIDIGWGIVLTAAAAWAGKLVQARRHDPAEP